MPLFIVTETFGWEEGLDKKFNQAKVFYIIVAISLVLGLSLNYIGISPIKALIYSAILYGLTAPVLIAIILHISNSKKIMGDKQKSFQHSWICNISCNDRGWHNFNLHAG